MRWFGFLLCLSLGFPCLAQEISLNQAKLLYDQGKYQECILLINKLVSQEKDNFEAHLIKGDCYQKEEKFIAAIESYEMAQKLNDTSALLHANHGAAYINLQQYEEAEKKLRKSLKLDPDLPEAHYFLGNLEYFDFRLIAAIKHYNKAIENRPEYRDALYMRAAANAELENYAEALRDYEKVMELDPALDVARFNVAVIRLHNDEYEKAYDLLSKVDPAKLTEPVNFYFYQAEALYFSGQKTEACKLYQKAMEMGDAESKEIYTRYCLNKEERKQKMEKRTIRMAF
jgi:Flp pilus assembly protein TadD